MYSVRMLTHWAPTEVEDACNHYSKIGYEIVSVWQRAPDGNVTYLLLRERYCPECGAEFSKTQGLHHEECPLD